MTKRSSKNIAVRLFEGGFELDWVKVEKRSTSRLLRICSFLCTNERNTNSNNLFLFTQLVPEVERLIGSDRFSLFRSTLVTLYTVIIIWRDNQLGGLMIFAVSREDGVTGKRSGKDH